MNDYLETRYRIFHEGKQAYHNDVGINEVPEEYSVDQDLTELWQDGWKEGSLRDKWYQHQSEIHYK
jgi:hypothetical protein